MPAEVSEELPDRSRSALGRYGEDLAVAYLRSLGMRILSRNWRCRQGELDIVALEDAVLVVCEVKTRSGHRYGGPLEAVNPRKLARIRRLAGLWLTGHEIKVESIRIDVIGIIRPPRGRSLLSHVRGV